MATEGQPTATDPPATSSLPEAAVVPDAGTIPVSEIVPLTASPVVAPGQVAEGTVLTGDEELKSKVTVRTRYPIDRFESGDTVITASGTKVNGPELPKLVKAASAAGIELEKI